ncbi:MAG TPA: GntR family transcriptional regulator [Blastocatellia bacterium]|nr:GntR family transcriptional regulator [Blastocatellia bacterium]
MTSKDSEILAMEDRFNIDSEDPTPIYAQLERAIRFAIATERLRVGEQLPTVRQLAVDLKINANTVAKVYAELERAGILETRRGVGTFVRARQDGMLKRESKQSRERELRAFADRILAEAHELGFSLDEVLDHLTSRRRKGD